MMTKLNILFYKLKLRAKLLTGRKKNKAVILDRDGTLNFDPGYISEIQNFKLFPETIPALKTLFENGFLLIIITNQSGIGRGYFTEKKVKNLHSHLEKVLAENGIFLAKIFFCPHRPEENCPCRKPNALLFEKAVRELRLDAEKCYSIGDKETDIAAAGKVNIKGLLLGRDAENILRAAEKIVNDS